MTSKEIMKVAGIKNIKTLTRWHQQGIIPPPLITTHPSGRGKIASWEPWVLDRCRRIVSLTRDGLTLRKAVLVVESERASELHRNQVQLGRPLSDLLSSRTVKHTGRSETLLRIILGEIADGLVRGCSKKERRAMVARLIESRILDQALLVLNEGGNPMLCVVGDEIHISPDFVIGPHLSSRFNNEIPIFLIPLYPVLCRAFSLLGKKLVAIPSRFPTSSVQVGVGGNRVEYDLYVTGWSDYVMSPKGWTNQWPAPPKDRR